MREEYFYVPFCLLLNDHDVVYIIIHCYGAEKEKKNRKKKGAKIYCICIIHVPPYVQSQLGYIYYIYTSKKKKKKHIDFCLIVVRLEQ